LGAAPVLVIVQKAPSSPPGRIAVMNLLRRVLYLEAALWGIKGLLLAAVPSWTTESLLGLEASPEHVWLRVAGIFAMTGALLMVLVAQSAEDNWFWTWAFVFAQGNLTLLFLLKAAFAPGGHAAIWWLCCAGSASMTALLLWGIARAYADTPNT